MSENRALKSQLYSLSSFLLEKSKIFSEAKSEYFQKFYYGAKFHASVLYGKSAMINAHDFEK